MKKLILSTIVAIVLVGVVVFLFARDRGEVPALSPTPTLTPTPVSEESPLPLSTPIASKVAVITYTDSGYSPSTVRIKRGDGLVDFKNTSSKMMWTASAVHPTHKAYPGSDIAKCGTLSGVDMFDSCKGYEPGESWAFFFDNLGTWKYHNHLQPNHTGTIVVE